MKNAKSFMLGCLVTSWLGMFAGYLMPYIAPHLPARAMQIASIDEVQSGIPEDVTISYKEIR